MSGLYVTNTSSPISTAMPKPTAAAISVARTRLKTSDSRARKMRPPSLGKAGSRLNSIRRTLDAISRKVNLAAVTPKPSPTWNTMAPTLARSG